MSGIIMIIVIALLIDWADTTREKRIQRDVEDAHKRAYDKIDKAYGDTLEAREYKAKMDVLVDEVMKEKNREYRPKNLERVTTKKERDERIEAGKNMVGYVSEHTAKALAQQIAREKNFEHYVQQRMRVFGCSRAEAEEIVRRSFEA